MQIVPQKPVPDWLKKLITERRQAKVARENQQQKLLPDEKLFHDSIRDKLHGLFETNQFANFSRCGEESIYRTCKCCGAVEEYSYRCSLKWCPLCQWRIAERRRKMILEWAKHITQPKHLVTTQKNFPILTAKKIREFQLNMVKLRRTLVFEKVQGGCVSIEITNEGRGWHLHAHWLVDARWVDAQALAITWGNLVGQDFAVVKVKDVREREYAQEICKYLAKGSEIASWNPAQILEFVSAIRGRRFFFAFGSLFKAGKQVRADLAKQKKPMSDCECGSHDFLFESELAVVLNQIRKEKSK